MTRRRVKPSAWYYVLAGAMAVTGVALFAAGVLAVFQSVLKLPQQVIVPGRGEVRLDRPGSYDINYEYRSVVDGKGFVTPEAFPGLQARLVRKETGQEVPLMPVLGSYQYTVGRRSGVGIWTFSIDRPGVFELSAEYPEGVRGPGEVVLAVGEGLPIRGFVKMVAGMLGMFALGCGAVVVFLVTLFKRIKADRQAPLPASASQQAD